jgi:hypothetical protein
MMLRGSSLAAAAACSTSRALAQRTTHQQQQHAALTGGASTARHSALPRRSIAMHAISKLSDKKCEPCEASQDALDNMGLAMVMDEQTAQGYAAQASCLLRRVLAALVQWSRGHAPSKQANTTRPHKHTPG